MLSPSVADHGNVQSQAFLLHGFLNAQLRPQARDGLALHCDTWNQLAGWCVDLQLPVLEGEKGQVCAGQVGHLQQVAHKLPRAVGHRSS